MSKPIIMEISAEQDLLNESNLLRYMTRNSKNPKSNCCCILIPFLGSESLAKGQKGTTSHQSFWVVSISLTSNFQGYSSLDW